MKITQSGTFDVFNYGDLLFPHITNKVFQPYNPKITYISPTNSTLNLNDSLHTTQIQDAEERYSDADLIIVGGGNIIHAEQTKLPAYRSSHLGHFCYADLWLIQSLANTAGTPVFWNAPGVPNLIPEKFKPIVKSALQRIDYISVRDEPSKTHLLDVWANANIRVIPDSAWQLDKVWPKHKLQKAYSRLVEEHLKESQSETWVVHLNSRYLGGQSTERIAALIDRISVRHQVKPIFLAIGLCHGDDKLARATSELIGSEFILIDKPDSLETIAASIACSKFYAGSSMHGFITAAVYDTPGFIIANPELPKFLGLEQLLDRKNLTLSTWVDLETELHTESLQKQITDLRAVKIKVNAELDAHWSTAINYALESRKKNNTGRQDRRSSEIIKAYKDLSSAKLEYADETITALKAVNELALKQNTILEKKNGTLQKKIEETGKFEMLYRGSNKLISRLQAEIKSDRASVSWKITTPLRALSRRFPNVGTFVIDEIIWPMHHFIKEQKRSLVNTPEPLNANSMKLYPPVETLENFRKASKEKKKIVIYTALVGNNDTLRPHTSLSKEIDYICFSDTSQPTYGVWKIREIPFYHTDPTRVARYVKTHPHALLPGYNIAIWIDANITLNDDPLQFVTLLQKSGNFFGAISHPHRSCVYEEANACIKRKKDSASVLNKQIENYQSKRIPENFGLYETGFTVSNLSHSNSQQLFSAWWKEIDNHSRRDQIALVSALFSTQTSVTQLLPNGVSVREDDRFIYLPHRESKQLKPPEELKSHINKSPPLTIGSIQQRLEIDGNADDIDIIVCVYNALSDVSECLTSVEASTEGYRRLIIVNDFSDGETTEYLRSKSSSNTRIFLIENTENLGYTKSANIGLRASEAKFKIVLNSDTVVSKGWATKLFQAAFMRDEIGIVGPMSNAAGSQSIPNIKSSSSNTAINALPDDMSIKQVNNFCESHHADVESFPIVPLVHGFCFAIKASVIEAIGYFDEENFSRYYGEENDYCFRARKEGFEFIIATNTYIFHKKSKSISDEQRIIHMDKAGKKLREIYGKEALITACVIMEKHPLLVRIRSHSSRLFQ